MSAAPAVSFEQSVPASDVNPTARFMRHGGKASPAAPTPQDNFGPGTPRTHPDDFDAGFTSDGHLVKDWNFYKRQGPVWSDLSHSPKSRHKLFVDDGLEDLRRSTASQAAAAETADGLESSQQKQLRRAQVLEQLYNQKTRRMHSEVSIGAPYASTKGVVVSRPSVGVEDTRDGFGFGSSAERFEGFFSEVPPARVTVPKKDMYTNVRVGEGAGSTWNDLDKTPHNRLRFVIRPDLDDHAVHMISDRMASEQHLQQLYGQYQGMQRSQVLSKLDTKTDKRVKTEKKIGTYFHKQLDKRAVPQKALSKPYAPSFEVTRQAKRASAASAPSATDSKTPHSDFNGLPLIEHMKGRLFVNPNAVSFYAHNANVDAGSSDHGIHGGPNANSQALLADYLPGSTMNTMTKSTVGSQDSMAFSRLVHHPPAGSVVTGTDRSQLLVPRPKKERSRPATVTAAASVTRSTWVKKEERSQRSTALDELNAFDSRLQAQEPSPRARQENKAHHKMEAHFRKESRRIFNAIDKDSSGRIDHEELAEGLNDSSSFLRLCGLAKVDFEELKSLADSWDLESFTRYALWHMRRVTCCRREKEEKEAALVEQAWMVFLSIDTNGDSQLDQAELAAGVKTNRALNRLFKGELVVGDFIPESVDRNKDGLVSFDEFKEAVLAEASGASQEALDDAAFACEEGDLGCLFG